MSITQTTPQAAIEAAIKQRIERMKTALIYNLNHVGDTCVNEAKNNGSYTDRTNKLRNSLGYVIVVDGAIHTQIIKGTGEGAEAGKKAIQEMVAKFPHGIALIVVAGANYAAAVEAKNYNVLSSAELMAEQLVPQILTQLGISQ